MLIADLKQMAGGMGISGAAKMKKADLVDAIKAAQSGGRAGGGAAKAEPKADRTDQKPKAGVIRGEAPGRGARRLR